VERYFCSTIGGKGVSASKEWWNEPEAVLLLQRAGKLVQAIESSAGRPMPQSDRELYHARLLAAHDAQDMAAYRIALEEYVEGARKARRKPKGERQREEG
jgi:hypothetical protein